MAMLGRHSSGEAAAMLVRIRAYKPDPRMAERQPGWVRGEVPEKSRRSRKHDLPGARKRRGRHGGSVPRMDEVKLIHESPTAQRERSAQHVRVASAPADRLDCELARVGDAITQGAQAVPGLQVAFNAEQVQHAHHVRG